MAATDFIVAIELGSSKITGIAGKKHPDGSIQVLALASEPSSDFIRKGVIYNLVFRWLHHPPCGLDLLLLLYRLCRLGQSPNFFATLARSSAKGMSGFRITVIPALLLLITIPSCCVAKMIVSPFSLTAFIIAATTFTVFIYPPIKNSQCTHKYLLAPERQVSTLFPLLFSRYLSL